MSLVCVCVCVCVHAIFRHTYFQTAVLPNEGDSYIYYCTIVSPLPTLFQILSMSFRYCCVWMLQAPEHMYAILISEQEYEFSSSESSPHILYQTWNTNSPNLALFGFQLWRVVHVPLDMKIVLAGVCVSIFEHQLWYFTLAQKTIPNKVGGWLTMVQ